WGGVEFDKWFGFAGLVRDDYLPTLGFATRLGSLYTGFYYNGNIARVEDWGKGENTYVSIDGATGVKNGENTYYYVNRKRIESTNNFFALFGIGSMGFRLGIEENLDSRDAPDSGYKYNVTKPAAGGTTYSPDPSGSRIYDSYTQIRGSITPSLDWGMNLNLGGRELSPYASFGLEIGRDRQESVYNSGYTTNAAGQLTTAKTSVGTITDFDNNYNNRNARDYVAPKFGLGADLALSDTGTLKISAGLGYDLEIRSYSTGYDFFGNSGKAKGGVKAEDNRLGLRNDLNASAVIGTGGSNLVPSGSDPIIQVQDGTTTTAYTSLIFGEQSYSSNTISPSFTLEGELGNLKLGFGARLPLSFISGKNGESREEYFYTTNGTNSLTVTRTQNDPGSKEFRFELYPELDLGASYALVPSRFSINAGLNLYLPSLRYQKNSWSGNGNDGISTTSVSGTGSYAGATLGSLGLPADNTPAPYPSTWEGEDKRTSWGSFGAQATAGFTFNFTENYALDLAATGGGTRGKGVNLTNVDVIFSVKF
ncbi:MAG: hypothetical protein LBI94_08905, partial [Treponema sp.]|nr:hypothetical protein [Treponema sp.]